tara:strand:+ start:2589 stop:2882 length:294 start_codon:yes stop_codon:yes gene_type:complete
MIELVALTALSIIGLNRSVDMLLYTFTGNDLDAYYDMMDGKWYQKWSKPLMTCVYCMASLWGATLLITWDSFGGWWLFIPSILAVAGSIHVLLSFEK